MPTKCLSVISKVSDWHLSGYINQSDWWDHSEYHPGTRFRLWFATSFLSFVAVSLSSDLCWGINNWRRISSFHSWENIYIRTYDTGIRTPSLAWKAISNTIDRVDVRTVAIWSIECTVVVRCNIQCAVQFILAHALFLLLLQSSVATLNLRLLLRPPKHSPVNCFDAVFGRVRKGY